MEKGGTGGANVKAESTREDPRATPGLVSNLPHPRVNKTKQHPLLGAQSCTPRTDRGTFVMIVGALVH